VLIRSQIVNVEPPPIDLSPSTLGRPGQRLSTSPQFRCLQMLCPTLPHSSPSDRRGLIFCGEVGWGWKDVVVQILVCMCVCGGNNNLLCYGVERTARCRVVMSSACKSDSNLKGDKY
jgi:hypothetical protein